MLGTELKPVVTALPTTEETQKLKKLNEKNDDGYSHLLLTVSSNKDIRSVASATTTEQPTGCLPSAWTKLNKNYKPTTGRSKNELIQSFYSLYLDKMSYPPELWFNSVVRMIDDLANLHSFIILDNDLVSHVLANTRHEYDATILEHRTNLRLTVTDIPQLIKDLQE